MKNHAKLACGQAVFFGAISLVCAHDLHAGYVTDPVVESVVRGDQTYAFPAGYIRTSQPLDGIVNQVTGDNQVTGNRMISGGTHSFYLRMNVDHDVTLGTLYTVYRRAHKVYHPVTGRYLGELIHQLGVVRVTEMEGRVATAKLVASFNPIGPGDHVMRFTPPADEETVQPVSQRSSDTQGMVVDFIANRTLTGARNIVYLDRGRNDGYRIGDVLQLFRTGGGLPRRVLGEVKVVAVEDGTSTAFVTKAIAPVLIGDRVVMKSPTQAAVDSESLPVTEKEQVRQLAKKIDELARESQGQATMRIDEAGKRVIVSLSDLEDHVYFDSGEAQVQADALPLLRKIGETLKEMPDHQIRVEGHTDSQEIGPSLKNKFPSNWELSKARAAGVARFLVQEVGLDADRLISVGYGATQPVAPNTSEDGRQKNRRVEIVLQPGGTSKETTPGEVPSFTDHSVPPGSAGTTLSTVATPSLNESVSAPDGSAVTPDASPDPMQPADPTGSEISGGGASPEGGPASQSELPVSEAVPADGRTTSLPASPDAPPVPGSL